MDRLDLRDSVAYGCSGKLITRGRIRLAEVLDIYDASLRHIGTMERGEAHATGQWHRTFHCWIVDVSRRRIIFQTRSIDNKTHPGKLDISAAGHLEAGESVADGIREVQEELGLTIDFSDLLSAGDRVEVSDRHGGPHNREYQAVYFYVADLGLEQFDPDPAEVAGLASIGIADALDLFSGRVKSIEVETVDAEAGAQNKGTRAISTEDFIPRIQRYYLAASITADRLCDGKLDIAIS